ncbi:uncharacterized protein ASCRUDRAFT_33085 [Ascoidea rubescens DSM 1968]|uniref:Uncharacterized protein n=1 Tax=Ascoidea rubescens DSM 1968 TaxID=1344418 RepID=A0A1D2VKE7_9ASCO|nr:hypothetical protein ASCRUDRAFT_33085 [Ascoidea rubescens DSM 1968]ODV62083.1 hypothetical protein ASCRUDRAFT_33085 [Ascoidea rubescens DSM 1968]
MPSKKLPTKDSSQELIKDSITNITRIIENDTDISLIDLNLIQQLNTQKTLNLMKLERKLDLILNESKQITQINEDLTNTLTKLNVLENQVNHLERIAKEMDEWSKELQVKSRRIRKQNSI